jgi:hypothetical protein
MDNVAKRNFRLNYIVNLLDGGFFGFALGFASLTTVIPLFVSNMTDSDRPDPGHPRHGMAAPTVI